MTEKEFVDKIDKTLNLLDKIYECYEAIGKVEIKEKLETCREELEEIQVYSLEHKDYVGFFYTGTALVILRSIQEEIEQKEQ